VTPLPDIAKELRDRFCPAVLSIVRARDGVDTVWVAADTVREVLSYLKSRPGGAYAMLYDLTGIDERSRRHHAAPMSDFTVVYQLLSLELNHDLRIKVPLTGERPVIDTIAGLWPNSDWYERELWDMFGIEVRGHKDLRRILCPPWWQGHPLRKEHPARATELSPDLSPQRIIEMEEQLIARRPDSSARRPSLAAASGGGSQGWPPPTSEESPASDDGSVGVAGGDGEFTVLNFGPHHPGTHGVLRLVLKLDGERIVGMAPDIGFHHRGAEKMGERQSWHTYIPYTDRIDYLAGVVNELPYVLAVEKLAGIEVPDRVKVMRVMLTELFRIISHLVWYGTFTLDLGAMSPTFYMFSDRERALDIIEAVTGARMHPGYFRIGGLADDLPGGWEKMFREFLAYMPRRLDEYDAMMMKNGILKARTVGVGAMTTAQAIDWGVTGPNLRATGLVWDWRKKRPYSGYERFEFDIPTGTRGDCYDRAAVRVAEIRQSLRIIQQCVDNMPAGEHKSRSPLATPPIKGRTLADIETLITHFLGVSWGPVIPAGEAAIMTEGAKGSYSYYLTSDGGGMSYRTRIRTPSFPHIQAMPAICQGISISDLVAILGSIDFVLADIDR
jgi:NADH-quinone oxidoreductase subunit C/D